MSFFVDSGEKFVDKLTDIENFRHAAPQYWEPRLQAMKELRQAQDALSTFTGYGMSAGPRHEWRQVASIPHTVLQAALVIEPDLLLNKTKFYKWLRKHKEYSAYTMK